MTLLDGLFADDASIRLRAAMAAGTAPDDALIRELIERCAVEPDFFVRDMLTWALTRHPSSVAITLLLAELHSERAQARSQALHTLSKIGDPGAWPAIPPELLSDADGEVARSAWRAAVVLAPPAEYDRLAVVLASQLGRGDREMHRSLSRAMVALGDVIEPALDAALHGGGRAVCVHARATRMLLADPDAGVDSLLDEAGRGW